MSPEEITVIIGAVTGAVVAIVKVLQTTRKKKCQNPSPDQVEP
jgi:hypothetical protein